MAVADFLWSCSKLPSVDFDEAYDLVDEIGVPHDVLASGPPVYLGSTERQAMRKAILGKSNFRLFQRYFGATESPSQSFQLLPPDARALLSVIPDQQIPRTAKDGAQMANSRPPPWNSFTSPLALYSWDRDNGALPGISFNLFQLTGGGPRYAITVNKQISVASFCYTHDYIWFFRMNEGDTLASFLNLDPIDIFSAKIESDSLHLIVNLRILFRICTLMTRGWKHHVQAVTCLEASAEGKVSVVNSELEFCMKQNIKILQMVRHWVLRNYKAVVSHGDDLIAYHKQVVTMFDVKVPEMISNLDLLVEALATWRLEADDVGSSRFMYRIKYLGADCSSRISSRV